MGNLTPKAGNTTTSSGIHFAPFPYRFRCPFGSDGTETDRLSINYLRTILSDPESGITTPAALLLEVVQGEGGCIPASDEWLRAVRELTFEFNIPLIIDEVQCGFGRTGRMFSFERAKITPDVLVLSKALGGGYPLAAIVYNESLDKWPRGMHAGTFRGNQIAMLAGRATMNIIRRDRLDALAEDMGLTLTAGLKRLADKFPVLGDIRGPGLMIGIEIVKLDAHGYRALPDGRLAREIKLAAFREGLLIESGGRFGSVLRFLPPLNITKADVADILSRLERAISAAISTPHTFAEA
jgi:diaminobutyrate-2-oxoglutarate transaminase